MQNINKLMKRHYTKVFELNSTFSSNIPSPKKHLLKSYIRKHSKPIIFKEKTSDEIIYKNLAKSAKLNSPLRISKVPGKTSKVETTRPKLKLVSNIPSSKQSPENFRIVQIINIARENTPIKYRMQKQEKLKPMLLQYSVYEEKFEIEGRPCSRTQKYPYLETKNIEPRKKTKYDSNVTYIPMKKIEEYD
jgi:hypothetical protein